MLLINSSSFMERPYLLDEVQKDKVIVLFKDIDELDEISKKDKSAGRRYEANMAMKSIEKNFDRIKFVKYLRNYEDITEVMTEDFKQRIEAKYNKIKISSVYDVVKEDNPFFEVFLENDMFAQLINDGKIEYKELQENQYGVVKSKVNSSIVYLAKFKNHNLELVKERNICTLKAQNREQIYAIDALYDKRIELVILEALAGSGKTLLSLASGIDMIEKGYYNKIIVCKPLVKIGEGIGFLPGTKDEKISPWLGSLQDNLEVFIKSKNDNVKMYLDMLMRPGKLVLEDISFLRGRSLNKCFVIIEEAQNLDTYYLNLILSRLGKGSKIVLNGNLDQIDNINLSRYKTALYTLKKKFVGKDPVAYIRLNKCLRSKIAELACELL